MKPVDYYFSVLRIMPNPLRGERVNIGLVLYNADKSSVSVHLRIVKEKLLSLDPNLSIINWETWADRTKLALLAIPAENRTSFLRTSFAPITTDQELGWFKAASSEEVTENVDSLLKRLVQKPERLVRAPRQKKRQGTHLQAQLKHWFKAQNIMGRSIEDLGRHQIVSEYPISLETESFADFAFKNGALHIMETMDLRGIDHLTPRLRNQAAFKSVVLDQAADVIKGGGQRIAVISASDYPSVRSAIKMIERNADDMISMESQQDIERLITRLSTALHLPKQLLHPEAF